MSSFSPHDLTGRHSRVSSATSVARRALGRLSYGSFTESDAQNDVDETDKRRPSIPSVLPQNGEVKSTPLPMLSVTVLSITMLGEFLSACVSTPYMLFMVASFGTSDVSFWTGILVATFFLTQFLTSLLWQIVADKYGRRTVLIASLLGGSISCTSFGTSRTLVQALCFRAMQGLFAGAIGVARGSVSAFTDPTNEGQAYAILGFCWGFGGVSGSMIGGIFESPALKWPEIFGNMRLFNTMPYLLPCFIAGSIMLFGAILACFLGPDGGPRNTCNEKETKDVMLSEEGNLQVVPEDEHSRLLPKPAVQPIPIPAHRRSVTSEVQATRPQTSGVPMDRTYTFTSTRSRQNSFGVPMNRTYTMGSSSSGFRPRLAREATSAGAAAAVMARRRISTASVMSASGTRAFQRPRRSMYGDENGVILARSPSGLGLARRYVLANENAVNHIADLWVAAAMFGDQGDDYYGVDPTEYWGSDNDEDAVDFEEDAVNDTEYAYSRQPSHSQAQLGNGPFPSRAPASPTTSPNTRTMALPSPSKNSFSIGVNTAVSDSPVKRRVSFNHLTPGSPASPLLMRSEVEPGAESSRDGLAPIIEGAVLPENQVLKGASAEEQKLDNEPSLISQIPVPIIIQYGLLAFHATTHDQVFMSHLVSNYSVGGLNLNAGHFAQLIALMSFAQIFYQFYLYPHLGPPRGPFGYLTMFRISSGMFFIGYLAMIPLRTLASPDGNGTGTLMAALATNMAFRFCAGTFGYTSISILLNYMTPPHAVGYANGIAQSVVSLARCIGPILGGFLWSASTDGNPEGYPFAFIACAGICLLAALHCTLIR
ncbi:hypothetical protein D9758_000830 [Tetrapyrgos nigripes]|uniref:Major facilitator superfamily MFS-1 n=1 Tax=Tetrapyrgos nigripes TaxID=182062 RepID=A0A8H5LY19_9AGAR|nr:hypothetical protein D9758_000830 [Tetrapyrgos nigripes]